MHIHSSLRIRFLRYVLAACSIVIAAHPLYADLTVISGGGNFTNGSAATSQMTALTSTGAKALRISLYPDFYWNSNTLVPQPGSIDRQMDSLYAYGCKPVVILFEYYKYFSVATDAPRDSATWFAIGRAFAEKWRPGSAYLAGRGIRGWGTSVYQAINEPDETDGIPYAEYVAMLSGLAAGVHSIDASLKVIPGGFKSENEYGNHTLAGYGTAIAPLLNAGVLDGIDLHTYNDVQYAPIEKTSNGEWFFAFSPQSDFDDIKSACGITRDITFYTTEYGFKNNTQNITEDYCAKRLLTCIWANLGVVKKDGRTPATGFALVWQLFHTVTQDPTYGLASQLTPAWVGNAPGKTFQLAMRCMSGMSFTSLDPKGTGIFELDGIGRKMWVWQNLPKWSSVAGTSITLDRVPANCAAIEVYRWDSWDGAFQTVAVNNRSSVTISGLVANQTYMFIGSYAPQTALRPALAPRAAPDNRVGPYRVLWNTAVSSRRNIVSAPFLFNGRMLSSQSVGDAAAGVLVTQPVR